jgi:tetratricopeptide (TPR) repeat protein
MYMSPEQATGMSEVVDPKSDVYSLGVVLYEAVTGRVPFDGADTLEILRRVANEAPPPPRAHLPSIDRTLEGIIGRAMAKDPAQRYPTAVAMSEDLERWALGRPVEAPRVVTLPPEPKKRLPVLPIAIFGFVAVIALLIGTLALISRGRTEASLEGIRREAADLAEAGGREVELARRALYRPGVPDAMPVELDRAMTTLRKSLNLHETAEAHYQMGRAHDLLRRPDEAAREYRRCLAMSPDHLGAALGISRHLYEEIFESAWDGRAVDADAVRAHIAVLERHAEPQARVHALLLKREFREAAQRASEIARSRNDEEYAYLTGMAFCSAKLHDTSKAWLKRAIEACPNFYEARHARGHVNAELGDHDAAIADFRAAGAVPPAQSSMVAHEAQLLSRLGRLPEAIGALDRAIALRPEARLFFDRARLHEKAGSLDAATRDYGDAIKHWPEWSAAWAARAALWLARGMMSDALADAEQAVRLAPKDAAALLVRGEVRLNANDPRGAHADFSAAVDANPWSAAAYAGRARSSLRLAQFRVADDDFTRAIGMGGKPEPVWYLERATSRLEIGKWEDARSDAEEYLRLLPGGPSAHEANRIKEEARRRLEGS